MSGITGIGLFLWVGPGLAGNLCQSLSHTRSQQLKPQFSSRTFAILQISNSLLTPFPIRSFLQTSVGVFNHFSQQGHLHWHTFYQSRSHANNEPYASPYAHSEFPILCNDGVYITLTKQPIKGPTKKIIPPTHPITLVMQVLWSFHELIREMYTSDHITDMLKRPYYNMKLIKYYKFLQES